MRAGIGGSSFVSACALTSLLTVWAPSANADPIGLTVVSGPLIQQTENRPCIFGDPSCHNPDSLPYKVFEPGKKGESGTLDSHTYTVDQIREIVGGDSFSVGVDLNQAMGHNDGAYALQSFSLAIDGVLAYSTIGPSTLYPLNPGNGYSDAMIQEFSLAGLLGTQTLVFNLSWSDATAGREQYFLIGNGTDGGDSPNPVPEPASLLLFGSGVAGVLLRRLRQ